MKSGMAVLEEYLQEKYVELYDVNINTSGTLAKLDLLRTAYPKYFYQPTEITGLTYILNRGNMYFLIQKENLPQEIQEQLRGGDAGDKSFSAYSSLTDVYGVTSNLKVYYCSDGLDSLTGTVEILKDSGSRLAISNSSSFGNYLKSVDGVKTDNSGNVLADGLSNYGILTIQDTTIASLDELYNLSSLTRVNIINSTINSLKGVELASLLNYVYIKDSTISDFSSLGNSSSIVTLEFENMQGDAFSKFCDDMSTTNNSSITTLALNRLEGNISKINDLPSKLKSNLKYLYNDYYQDSVVSIGDGFTNLYELRPSMRI